ncbi:MAG: HAD hydrolase-like protein [Cryomorphaceae bacterium]|nr:HAD hydrolase-like protein [Cryomorphaceae bacterium]
MYKEKSMVNLQLPNLLNFGISTPVVSESPSYRLTKEINQRTKLVVTDVDGTLSSFWDYFVPSIRDTLKEMSHRSNIPVSALAEDIGRVVERHGTHEYPWLLEETDFARTHYSAEPEKFVEEFVKPFWRAMDENRKKYLRPFPGVLRTLSDLRERGIKVVALSDAPDYMARIRNQQIFDGLLDAVYALKTVEPEASSPIKPITLSYGRRRLQELKEATDKLKTRLIVLPKDYEKPNPTGLDTVLKDFGALPYETLFIGDSLKKDGVVAATRGIRFIWAHYGIHLPVEYDDMVHNSLKPSELANRLSMDAKPAHTPIVKAIVARYDELLSHV